MSTSTSWKRIRCQDASQSYQLMYEHIQKGSQRAFQLALGSLSSPEPQSTRELASRRSTDFAPSSSGTTGLDEVHLEIADVLIFLQ